MSTMSQSSHVRSSLFRCDCWTGFPTVDFAVVPNNRHRGRGHCAHVDGGNPGKTVTAEWLVPRAGTVQRRPTVDANAQVSTSPQHRDRAPPCAAIMVRTCRQRRGRWLGELHLVLLSLLHVGWVIACLARELFVVMIVNADFEFRTRARSASPPNTEVMPNKF
jgi:hypothetical protein